MILNKQKALSIKKERDYKDTAQRALCLIRTLLAKGAYVTEKFSEDTAGLPADEEAYRISAYTRGREPSRIAPMAVSRPLLNHGSGGCSGFEPDSLLIYLQ